MTVRSEQGPRQARAINCEGQSSPHLSVPEERVQATGAVGDPKCQESVHGSRVAAKLEGGVAREPLHLTRRADRLEQVGFSSQDEIEGCVCVTRKAPYYAGDTGSPRGVGIRFQHQVLAAYPLVNPVGSGADQSGEHGISAPGVGAEIAPHVLRHDAHMVGGVVQLLRRRLPEANAHGDGVLDDHAHPVRQIGSSRSINGRI